jgi:hypothetical protein
LDVAAALKAVVPTPKPPHPEPTATVDPSPTGFPQPAPTVGPSPPAGEGGKIRVSYQLTGYQGGAGGAIRGEQDAKQLTGR